TEAMLLVYDRHPEIVELHFFLQQSMRADEDLKTPIAKTFVKVLSYRFFCRSGQQRDGKAHAVGVSFQSVIVLLRQDLGRRHQRALCIAGGDEQHTDKSYDGFSAADIALQQPVHLLS